MNLSVIASIIHATYRAIDTNMPAMYAHVASSGLIRGHATARNAVAMNSMNGSLCTIYHHVLILTFRQVIPDVNVFKISHDISPVDMNVTR